MYPFVRGNAKWRVSLRCVWLSRPRVIPSTQNLDISSRQGPWQGRLFSRSSSGVVRDTLGTRNMFKPPCRVPIARRSPPTRFCGSGAGRNGRRGRSVDVRARQVWFRAGRDRLWGPETFSTNALFGVRKLGFLTWFAWSAAGRQHISAQRGILVGC